MKASNIMVVRVLGKLMETNVLWPAKAAEPITVIPLGMTVFLQPETSVFVAVSMTALQPFLES